MHSEQNTNVPSPVQAYHDAAGNIQVVAIDVEAVEPYFENNSLEYYAYMDIHSADPELIPVILEARNRIIFTHSWTDDEIDGRILDEDGNVRLDEKNPDRSLRHVECDKIVLFSGLKYEPSKDKWSDAKLYDPTRGIRANMTCEFEADGKLKVKGSLLGFSQSIYWIPLEK